jgi:hypothetical protein
MVAPVGSVRTPVTGTESRTTAERVTKPPWVIEAALLERLTMVIPPPVTTIDPSPAAPSPGVLPSGVALSTAASTPPSVLGPGPTTELSSVVDPESPAPESAVPLSLALLAVPVSAAPDPESPVGVVLVVAPSPG